LKDEREYFRGRGNGFEHTAVTRRTAIHAEPEELGEACLLAPDCRTLHQLLRLTPVIYPAAAPNAPRFTATPRPPVEFSVEIRPIPLYL